MTKREFLDIVFALAPTEANAIMDAFDEYVDSNEPHWIPCSEKLPEEEVDVLCCTRHGMLFVASYDTYNKEWISTECHRFWWKDVYAWTALPERPRGVTI